MQKYIIVIIGLLIFNCKPTQGKITNINNSYKEKEMRILDSLFQEVGCKSKRVWFNHNHIIPLQESSISGLEISSYSYDLKGLFLIWLISNNQYELYKDSYATINNKQFSFYDLEPKKNL